MEQRDERLDERLVAVDEERVRDALAPGAAAAADADRVVGRGIRDTWRSRRRSLVVVVTQEALPVLALALAADGRVEAAGLQPRDRAQLAPREAFGGVRRPTRIVLAVRPSSSLEMTARFPFSGLACSVHSADTRHLVPTREIRKREI